ncbi:MAG: ABC transporter substrate-binding protein, partial [Mariprofundus sp.]
MDSRPYSSKLILILLPLLMAACSTQERSGATDNPPEAPVASIPAHGDRLIEASIGDASNLIPMIAGDASSHAIADQLYLSLLKYDRNLDLVGQLAESWEVSDDQLSIIFKLRQGLTWTDSMPLTSADCAFTLALIQDENTQSAYKSDYAKVVRFEMPDARTFKVSYSEPYSPALSTWSSLAILPRHVFEGENIMDTELSRKPKATIGPYMLADWQSQQSIRLRANPDYYDGDVWITERMTRIIPDPATQFLELSAGNIDSMGLTPIQYSRLFETKDELKNNYKRYKYLNFVYTYLGFNLTRKPFNDVRVRQALAFAIDRQELIDGVLMGLGESLATPYKPGTYWVNNKLSPRAYDIEKARQLLAQAGWKDA